MEPALDAVDPAVVDVVLMDLDLPGMSGIDGIRLLKARPPAFHLVALTVYEDNDRILEALCSGTSGYLLKTTPPGRLLDCLPDTVRGGAAMSAQIAARVIALFREFRVPAPPEDRELSPLAVRILTVAFHMKSIYAKLQVHSESEAVAKALRIAKAGPTPSSSRARAGRVGALGHPADAGRDRRRGAAVGHRRPVHGPARSRDQPNRRTIFCIGRRTPHSSSTTWPEIRTKSTTSRPLTRTSWRQASGICGRREPSRPAGR